MKQERPYLKNWIDYDIELSQASASAHAFCSIQEKNGTWLGSHDFSRLANGNPNTLNLQCNDYGKEYELGKKINQTFLA